MIIQCQGCAAKYFLSREKVPPKPIKVRCPKCGAVFRLDPESSEENLVARAAPEVVASTNPPAPEGGQESAGIVGVTIKERPINQPPGRSKKESKEERARRLARVLVSDILWYNKEKRDEALIDGNLMTVMGEEIKKSWELYKEKVGVDLANSTGYFKQALNEILADGQKIF